MGSQAMERLSVADGEHRAGAHYHAFSGTARSMSWSLCGLARFCRQDYQQRWWHDRGLVSIGPAPACHALGSNDGYLYPMVCHAQV